MRWASSSETSTVLHATVTTCCYKHKSAMNTLQPLATLCHCLQCALLACAHTLHAIRSACKSCSPCMRPAQHSLLRIRRAWHTLPAAIVMQEQVIAAICRWGRNSAVIVDPDAGIKQLPDTLNTAVRLAVRQHNACEMHCALCAALLYITHNSFQGPRQTCRIVSSVRDSTDIWAAPSGQTDVSDTNVQVC